MTENEKKYFEAGEKLRTVGASFLVSYLYWKKIDQTHNNWIEAITHKGRLNNIKNIFPIRGKLK